MERASDILRIISARKAAGEPFALATVVRTVAATAAKAGAKAVILPDGTISEGWIGGGCARAAVLKAAKDALTDGKSRLVSVQPPDLLDQQGHAPGEEQGGVRFAKNMCPSQGTMDIFVEPVLPRSQIIICGSSPVAVAVAEEHLVGEAERHAVRPGAAHHRLMVVVAHGVLVGEPLEHRHVALLHVEERHRLARVGRRAGGRRAVGGRDG